MHIIQCTVSLKPIITTCRMLLIYDYAPCLRGISQLVYFSSSNLIPKHSTHTWPARHNQLLSSPINSLNFDSCASYGSLDLFDSLNQLISIDPLY